MKIVVYTVGTFDLLHVGHVALLNHCKTLGDILAVGVASDEVVNIYKPLMASSLKAIDYYKMIESNKNCTQTGCII